MFIYCITNTANSKVYIGQTRAPVLERFKGHYKDAFRKDDPRPLYCAMRKYGVENFKITVLDTAYTREELNNKEIHWIEKLQAQDRTFGYNIARGGEGRMWGLQHTNVTKQKLSDANKGKAPPNKGIPMKEEQRQKLIGRKRSEETREKIRAARAKQRMSDEQKMLISQRNKLNNPCARGNKGWFTRLCKKRGITLEQAELLYQQGLV